MGKYILKRLLLAAPTLFGITIITFLIIRLAPGDPTDLSQGMKDMKVSQDRIVLTKKLYGLDKPILINLDVKDRSRMVLGLWEEWVHTKKKETFEALKSFGKRLIPYLTPIALESGNRENQEAALQLLREGAGVPEAKNKASLDLWWKGFKEQSISHWIEKLRTAPESRALEIKTRIQKEFGALALPQVMEEIEGLDNEALRKRFIAYAAPSAGYPFALNMDSEDKRYQAALRFIRSWWKLEGLAYQEINGWERFIKTFTEAQYPMWLGRILTLDFGESYMDRRPVINKVWEAFKVTFTFQIIVFFLIYLISVPLGVFSAVKQNTLWDRVVTLFLFLLYSLPNFWIAYLLIMFLGTSQFSTLFPVQGLGAIGSESLSFWPWLLDRIWHMVLPIVCMTYGGLAVLSRYVRAGMLENIRKDYIRTARAKGLSEKAVIFRHALRNSLIPIVTLIGGLLPALLSGSVIIEKIFNIPGMGRLGLDSVLQRDYPVVMAIAFFSAVLVLLGMLLSDILYAITDPRIKFEETA